MKMAYEKLVSGCLYEIIKLAVWKSCNWYVLIELIIIIVIFAAAITSDGFVAAPMLLLYLLGMMLAKWQIKG